MTRDLEGHSDIVDRLRQRLNATPVLIGDSDPGVDLEADLRRALNEIERLRQVAGTQSTALRKR